MDETKELEIQAAHIGIKCFNSFYFFFKTFWSEMSGEIYHDNFHIKLICDILQEKAMRLIRLEEIMETIVISVPPGSSKSTIVTIAFPAWLHLHRPNFSTVNISYSATLSRKHASLARGIFDSEKFHLLFDNIFEAKHGKPLKIVKQNELEMVNNFKGRRFNTSTGGTLTGDHFNVIIEDDVSNPEQAESDAERGNAIRFHDTTVSTRLKNFMSYLNIIIAQRLHEDDVPGWVLRQNIPITNICLPGELLPNIPVYPEYARKLYIDGVLDPVRKPKTVLQQLEIKLGSAYSGQVLQIPFNLEAQAITPSMFEIIEDRDDIVWDLWIDGAYTEKTSNDPTGIMVAGYKDSKLYVRDAYNVYKTLPNVLKFIKELAESGVFDSEHGRIFIEPKASGYSLAQYIEEETDFNFVLIGQNTSKGEKNIVQQGKTARHNLIQPKAESNRIKLVKGNWIDGFLNQVCGFPKSSHDEMVDTLGYAVHHYFLGEKKFIDEKVLEVLEKNIAGYIPVEITANIEGYSVATEFKERDDGIFQMFDRPNYLYNYRYITVLIVKRENEAREKTVLLTYDRELKLVVAYFESYDISPQDAGKTALKMAHLYSVAKLVVVIRKQSTSDKTEENALSHIAIGELRKVRYENIYSHLKMNDIKHKREREYGLAADKNTTREMYYNLKEFVEHRQVKELPLEILSEIKMLERKKDSGEVGAGDGHSDSAALAYAAAVKIGEEMYNDVTPKKSGRW